MKRLAKTRATGHHIAGVLPLPRLSDEAVIQIHDFLHHLLDIFEARYGEQIDRFYDDLCEDCREDSHAMDLDDSAF